MKQYCLENIHFSGGQQRTVVKKIEENAEGKMAPGRIVVLKEQVCDATDEWH